MNPCKILPVFMTIALLSLAACSPTAGLPKLLLITRSYNGRSITVRQWRSFEVRLKEPGGTGYMWQIVNLDKKRLKLLSSSYVPLRTGLVAGAPILRIWKIQALKPGHTVLSILLFRPWETGKPADSFNLRITIR